MKKLSISTFGIFVFCLCLRTYSYLSYQELKSKVNNNQSLISDDKRKTIALLNTLNDLTTKNAPSSNYRELSSSTLEIQKQKDSLVIAFIEGFYASKDNLAELKHFQKSIISINKELNINDASLENLDLETLYFFVIRENFSLRDFQQNIIFEDLGFPFKEMRRIEKFSTSKEFKDEIYKFKNIYKKETETYTNFSEIENSPTVQKQVDKSMSFDDLPLDTQLEFLQAAEDQDVDLEKKLIEMDYTQEEVEEMLTGFEL